MNELKKLYTTIAKLEGKKSQVTIGNIREIVGIVSDELLKDLPSGSLYKKLVVNGANREADRIIPEIHRMQAREALRTRKIKRTKNEKA